MGMINNIKNNIKKEIDAFKYNRELENDPATVRNRLDMERNKMRVEKQDLLDKKQFESDKKEIQLLRNSTGVRGKITEGFGALKTHLNNVKQREARINKSSKINGAVSRGSFDIQGSKGINESPKASGGYRPFGNGVMGDSPLVKKQKKSKSQTIVIKVGK